MIDAYINYDNIFALSLRGNNPLTESMGRNLMDSLKGFSMPEIWKDVVGFKGCYQVSNLGNIKALDRKIKVNGPGKQKIRNYKGRLLKFGIITRSGTSYNNVVLQKSSRKKTILVHRVVMEAFVGKSKLSINHLDGNGQNNNLKNLEYCTARENNCHYKQSLSPRKIGVYKCPNGKWRAALMIGRSNNHLGYFFSEEDAYQAYQLELKRRKIVNKYSG